MYSSLFVSLDGNTQLNEGFSSSRTDLSSWTKRRVGSVLRHRFNTSLLAVTDQLEEFVCVCWTKLCGG